MCGHQAEIVSELISAFSKASVVHNPRWEEGLSSSLQAGLDALDQSVAGVLVALGDTPFFTSQTLNSIIPKPEESENIRIPVYQGAPGHPKYFPAWSFDHLRELRGDQGAKALIREQSERVVKLVLNDPGIVQDFDVPADFEESG